MQGACDLFVLYFPVFFEKVKLGIHSIDELLFLIIHSRPSFVRLFITLRLHIIASLLCLEHLMRLVPTQDQS